MELKKLIIRMIIININIQLVNLFYICQIIIVRTIYIFSHKVYEGINERSIEIHFQFSKCTSKRTVFDYWAFIYTCASEHEVN
jgi:hypothetical protein